MSVSAELLSALAAYLPQPLVELLREDPNREWVGYAQKQRAAVLFADLVGFTPMTEALAARGREGAEELTRILDEAFTALIDTCEDHGGVVGKFVGDALTVYWAAERERDLPAAIRRALACGLALQSRMASFSEVPTTVGSFHLAMRVGVAAGPIELRVAGDPRVGLEALLLGPPLLDASQAQETANPGEVVAHPSAAAEAMGQDRNAMLVVERLAHPPRRRRLPPISWDAVPNPEEVASVITRFLPPSLAERILLGQSAFAGELRHVTSVFASLKGYSRSSSGNGNRHNPHHLVDIDLSNAVAAAQNVVSAAGGRVNRVSVGDKGTMIHLIFGAPTANEDDAARAVWAARLLWAELTGQYGIGGVQVGVATGGVYAGPVGGPTRREYTVMGDAVNLSARLMQIAEPGQVVCDAPTVQEASGTFVWERLPPILVKGKSKPVEAWLASEAESIYRATPRQGPLFGRDSELTTLQRVLEKARQGEGQVVTIVGEGGIGKSRLLQAWQTNAFMDGWWVVVGQAAVTGRDAPYLSWRAWAAEMLACPLDAEPERLAEAAMGAIEALDPNLVHHWPLLGDLLGVPFPDTPATQGMEASQRRQALVELVARWVKVQAAKTPLFLALEDAQWADEASLELALEVGRVITTLPQQNSKGVVLVLVHRPLPLPISSAWQMLRSIVTNTITLSDLSPEDVCKLAAHRLGVTSLPDRLVALLVGKTQGHPFFAEELCRTLQEQGQVRVLDGRVQLSANLSSEMVPTSVEDLIQSRIDRLDERTRLTLRVASVLGTEVFFDGLLGSYPMPIAPPVLRQHLATLERLGLLVLEAEEPLSYHFKHSITQQVAYHSLLASQRRDLHGRAAQYFEKTLGTASGHIIDLLAYHYGRSDHHAKATHYLRLAGEQAMRQAAYAVAIDYLNQALERVDEGDYENRCRILEIRERIWRALGNLTARQQDLEALENTAQTYGDARWQARASFRRAVLAHDQGDYQTADTHLQEVIGQAATLNEEQLMGSALMERGNLLAGWSRYGDALICYEVAAELFAQKQALNLQAEAVRRRAEMQRRTADWVGALVSYEEAENLSEEAGDRAAGAMQRVDQAVLYMQLGMFDEAERDLLTAWQWAEQVDHRYILMESGGALGELYWNLERSQEAWSYLLIAYALSEEQDNPHHRMQILLVSAALLLDDGKPDEALSAAREARSLAAQIESLEGEVRAMALETEALAQKDPFAAAHGAWAAIDWLEQTEEPLGFGPSLYLALGRTFAASNDPETSQAMLRQAHDLLQTQANRVQPASLRRSFLSNPRVNREIQSLWSKLQGKAADHS